VVLWIILLFVAVFLTFLCWSAAPLPLPPAFFFQAEDGIRADLVTGVQTCALPISLSRLAARDTHDQIGIVRPRVLEVERRGPRQIGRASCRERVGGAEEAGQIEEQDWGGGCTMEPEVGLTQRGLAGTRRVGVIGG